MSTCADVGSVSESKMSVVQTSNVGFTCEVSDYLVVHTGPGQAGRNRHPEPDRQRETDMQMIRDRGSESGMLQRKYSDSKTKNCKLQYTYQKHKCSLFAQSQKSKSK